MLSYKDWKPKVPAMPSHQEYAWNTTIAGEEVSIVKWNWIFNNEYEIFSDEKLFPDVERYKTKEDVLKRLKELEGKL